MLELVAGEARFSHRGERHYTSPWGVFGGCPGARCRSLIRWSDGREELIPSKREFTLEAGDGLLLDTTGGGGYGSPFDREPERVLEDVLDGKVSREAAREDYGVVLEGDPPPPYRRRRNWPAAPVPRCTVGRAVAHRSRSGRAYGRRRP